MRKLVRSKRTKAFLKTDFTWTPDLSQAVRLEELTLPKLKERLLEKAEIYYSFDPKRQTEWDFTLPLP